jgi:hypothetical protein
MLTSTTRVEIAGAVRDAFGSGSAGREELVRCARVAGARGEVIALLEALPMDRRYRGLREIWADIPDVPVRVGAG